MNQTTTDKSQILSRLSHVDKVCYNKRWNHYNVHDYFRRHLLRHLDFFPLVPGFFRAWGGGGWGGVGVGEAGVDVLFWFLVFTWGCQEPIEDVNYVMNSQFSFLFKNFLTFTRPVETRPMINSHMPTKQAVHFTIVISLGFYFNRFQVNFLYQERQD